MHACPSSAGNVDDRRNEGVRVFLRHVHPMPPSSSDCERRCPRGRCSRLARHEDKRNRAAQTTTVPELLRGFRAMGHELSDHTSTSDMGREMLQGDQRTRPEARNLEDQIADPTDIATIESWLTVCRPLQTMSVWQQGDWYAHNLLVADSPDTPRLQQVL